MQIIHFNNDFIYTLFPTVEKGNTEKLIQAIKEFYSIDSDLPEVTVQGDLIIVDLNVKSGGSEESNFNKAVWFCEKGKYDLAKPILQDLIIQNPTNSEYYRILGQIASDEGDQDKAIDYLIDALRWDSKNGWALLMMGNIFAKFKEDVPTAMKYYDQALVANPKDNITMTNIGFQLLQEGKTEEAKNYLLKAKEIDSTFPNTHFALGMIYDSSADYLTAFNYILDAIKNNPKKDALFENSYKQLLEISKKVISGSNADDLYTEYLRKLEYQSETEIKIDQTKDIPTPAKFEFAENYNRDYHLLRYNPESRGHQHLIMHELVHLEFVLDARGQSSNKLFVTNQSHKDQFLKSIDSHIRKLSKKGYDADAIKNLCSSLFEGLNSLVYNAPIDLFIENLLFERHAELRPHQFISLLQLINQGIKSVTDSQVHKVAPASIISHSKVYNLVNTLQFKDLYGIDLTKEFKATSRELSIATAMYEEYLEYRDDKEPAEEYELIEHWADDLNLGNFFELVDENKYRSVTNKPESILDDIEADPYGEDFSVAAEKEKEMEKFLQTQDTNGLNMAVVMYMVDALEFMATKSKEEVKAMAYEIAMQGTQGFNPDKDGYRISSIKGKTFSGYHILAYYYVSWAIAIPEMLSKLQLPFEKEYELAQTLYSKK